MILASDLVFSGSSRAAKGRSVSTLTVVFASGVLVSEVRYTSLTVATCVVAPGAQDLTEYEYSYPLNRW